MKSPFLRAAASALIGLVLGASPASAQTLMQPAGAPRTIRLFVEDMNHAPVPAVVYYRDTAGEVALAEPIPEGGVSLPGAADLQTLLIKDPWGGTTQTELDLRGLGSLGITVCIDGLGHSKVMSVRQNRGFSNRNVAGAPGGIDLPRIPVFTPFGPLLGIFSIAVPNDDCEDALDIGSADEFMYVYGPFVTGTDGDEHAACEEFGEAGIEFDSWFLWTAPCTGRVLVSNCNEAVGDSKIAVYRGDALCVPGDLDLLACNDDFCGSFGWDSYVEFDGILGQQYLFRVGKSPAGIITAGLGEFSIDCVPAPTNDICADAIAVGVNTSTFGTTFGASVDDDVASTCPGPLFDVTVNSPGVWYTVIGDGGQLRASICNGDLDFLSKLTVYCGDCDSGLECVGAVNNQICALDPAVYWDSQLGVQYRILVHGALGHSGDFRLDVDNVGPCIGKPVACGEPRIGACCTDNGCVVTTDAECALLGGTFGGDDTDCCGRGIYEYESNFPGLPMDISLTGVQLFGAGTDEGQLGVSLGFWFDFMQGNFSDVAVSVNGGITFDLGQGLSFSNAPIPDTAAPQHIIAPLWTDWVVSDLPGAGVYVETQGTPGSRLFIAQWKDVIPFGGPNEPVTFLAFLAEGGNEIFFCYPDVLDDGGALSVPPATSTVGVENGAGTEGLSIPLAAVESAALAGRCLYVYRRTNFCGSPTVIISGAGNIVPFSVLDGGPLDQDGANNGVFTGSNLVIHDAQILVDVPSAVFRLSDLLLLSGEGRIDGETSPIQPDSGPNICVFACNGVVMLDHSRITANGAHFGGRILVCTDFGSVFLGDRAYLQANALHTSDPTWGGDIHVSARRKVTLSHYLTFMAVHGRTAGEIHVEACGGDADAVRMEGRLQAIGEGLQGVGGHVSIRAHKGGAFIPDYARLRVDGGILGSAGQAYVTVATTVTPSSPPSGIAPTIVTEFSPSLATCRCEAQQDNAGPIDEE